MKYSSSLPWYKKGLHFSCTECGKCCTGASGFVLINEQEIQEMAHFLEITVKNFKKLYIKKRNNQTFLIEKKSPEGYSCVFFRDKKCSVYSVRPSQCRLYPFWPENLLSRQAWEQAANFCEGITCKGAVFSQEKIDQMKEIQMQANELYVANE
ncbi:YkgJ family cysteine cluster protein [Candidatus Protochlamydia amoebophila]|uniref:YkgJ family cysteine cluster protein n=1 Tax=Candidatus Protochlamydia amoebophila TaxID=362787 RepID=UPI001BC8DC3B|nr:YkgJ family cysteine cluster protein [Candidatus Protochlamydia amoebophila]